MRAKKHNGIRGNVHSPVINSSSLRIIFAMAASRNLHIMKFNIKTVLLYGKLKEDIHGLFNKYQD